MLAPTLAAAGDPEQAPLIGRAAPERDVDDVAATLLDGATLPAESDVVVVQAGPAGAPAIVARTADAIVAAAARRWPQARVLRAPAAGETVRLGSPVLPGGVRVPASWLGSFTSITVSGVVADAGLRMAAVLAAQAGPLLAANPGAPSTALAYEAHRLGASDLCIACGNHPDGRAWWLAGSDLALETALAAAAGIDPRRLPAIAFLLRHETVTLAPVTVPAVVPSLAGQIAPAWRARLAGVRAAARAGANRLSEDARLAVANIYRTPEFLRRRLSSEPAD
jgi:hypothetical protein